MSNNGFSPLHLIHSGYGEKYLNALKALKKQGIEPTRGEWKPDELEQLDKNFSTFVKEYKIKDYVCLLTPLDKNDVKFRKETNFNLRMCQGIMRTKHQVSIKVVRKFLPVKKGRLSSAEKRELFRLYNMYGRKWTLIGRLLQRQPFHVVTSFTHISQTKNHGSWGKREESKLKQAVNSFISSGKAISWNAVSTAVGTRSSKTCLVKWLNYTRDQLNWNDLQAYKLINLIRKKQYDSENSINWKKIAKWLYNNKGFSLMLKYRFQKMKKNVSKIAEFEEVVKDLYVLYKERKHGFVLRNMDSKKVINSSKSKRYNKNESKNNHSKIDICHPEWTVLTSYELIKLINESCVNDEYLIDWVELSKHFLNVSPNWLKWKFGVLKKELPLSYSSEFTDIIEELSKLYDDRVNGHSDDDDELLMSYVISSDDDEVVEIKKNKDNMDVTIVDSDDDWDEILSDSEIISIMSEDDYMSILMQDDDIVMLPEYNKKKEIPALDKDIICVESDKEDSVTLNNKSKQKTRKRKQNKKVKSKKTKIICID